MRKATFALLFCISNITYGESHVSDLFYLPTKGQVAGRTVFNSDTVEISGEIGGGQIEISTEEQALNQTLAVGVSDWLAIAVRMPFRFDGELRQEVGSLAAVDSLDSELQRSVFSTNVHFDLSLLFLSY